MSLKNSTSSEYGALTGGDEAIAVPLGSSKNNNSNNNNGYVGFLENIFGPKEGRENHLFLGCCCDTRRAVMILNIISLTAHVITMIGFLVAIRIAQDHASDITEDINDQQVASSSAYDINENANVVVSEEDVKTGLHIFEGIFDIIMLFCTFLHAFGVYGALHYETWAIKIAAVAYAIPFTLAIFNFDFANFMVEGIFLYPHIVLIKEIETGVMTSSNYENVRACCVC